MQGTITVISIVQIWLR